MWISLLALPLKEKKIRYVRIDDHLQILRFEKSLSKLTLYVKKLEKATTLIVSLIQAADGENVCDDEPQRTEILFGHGS
ncbi:hypothetical protein EPI10_015350 [Gossypium australe]|uniref:Uncharacterized protein n=1 Tax=Gossypium australe TaxID=47621 RepID=A0A5B6VKC6_9ROSI|nr:hypothetical protein EPI10_015350 [Gossypium australe]